MIEFAEVALGTGGGVLCERCHGKAAPAKYSPTADVVSRVSRAVAESTARPGPNVALTGPEPFGHPELPAIVSGAVAAGVSRLRIDTDASALRSPENASGVLAAGARHFRVTLLGGSPGLHDVLSGSPGALDAALEGIAVLRDAVSGEGATVSLTALVPTCRHNLRDLPAIAAVAVEAGMDVIRLRIEDGGGEVAAGAPWITAACDTGVVNGVWVEIEGAPFCALPEHALHLSDVVRGRIGAKAPACAECALDPVCGGAPAGAGADALASLSPPPSAGRLAAAVSRARGSGEQ